MEELFTMTELESAGLIGPPRCTCLDTYTYPGRDTVFCSFCEAVDRAKSNRVKIGAA